MKTYLIGHNNLINGFRPAVTHPTRRLCFLRAYVSWSYQPMTGLPQFGPSNGYKVVFFTDFRRSPYQIPVTPDHLLVKRLLQYTPLWWKILDEDGDNSIIEVLSFCCFRWTTNRNKEATSRSSTALPQSTQQTVQSITDWTIGMKTYLLNWP